MLEEIIRAGVALPAPELEREPNMPPAVPPRNNRDSAAASETNKELQNSAGTAIANYMGSPTLLDAVEGGVVSRMEAEVVMEIGAYRRSVNYTALAVGTTPERVLELYVSGILKLRKWLSK
ncbi:MAG TPA: hypothetical protein VJC37_02295 [Planctomycetota bacterium]|nr:hypothetical protein [Planctomycetota bacterium]